MGTSHQQHHLMWGKHITEDIDAELQAKGLQKVAMDRSPNLLVS